MLVRGEGPEGWVGVVRVTDRAGERGEAGIGAVLESGGDELSVVVTGCGMMVLTGVRWRRVGACYGGVNGERAG